MHPIESIHDAQIWEEIWNNLKGLLELLSWVLFSLLQMYALLIRYSVVHQF